MYAINEKLQQRARDGEPVRVALIGLGQMGTDIVATLDRMEGMTLAAVVDISEDAIRRSLALAEHGGDIACVTTDAQARTAAANGTMVAVTDWRIAVGLPRVDVVIDATGSPELGATITLACIEQRKHIVMMNVECDVTVGPILHRRAAEAGVIYTMAAGDEPAAIMELYRFARALGFEVVAAGKGKNNPLNLEATPHTLAAKAAERNMSAHMLCEFVDGSKTAIEMAAVANATGLVPDVRGMHGAHATVADLQKVFCPIGDGGVLHRTGVVDFAIGVHPGVFLVVTTDSARLRDSLIQRDMGNGPNYCLFRPFHLCSIEVPLTAAQAVIYGESSGHPLSRLSAECIAVAKKDIAGGETLDGIGGFCYRVSIDTAEKARAEKLVPAGLVRGCVAATAIPKGTCISYDMLDFVDETKLLELRRKMDAAD
ncbi:MAG: NAD(P)-dependent oxidoreductase [Chitinivibrionales bacterium]|nr:NAD(P)-dependent oxidoreductase [Chitinivibrionales bacterium]